MNRKLRKTMQNILEYKGYNGSIEFDSRDALLAWADF